MRKDMHKVLTEDPRRGGEKFGKHRNCKGNDVFDDEFSGGKESMMKVRRVAGGGRKSFGDHLSPLKRFLTSRVGKKWDDVYSEICKTHDKRSWMHYHLHIHVLRDFVERDTVMHEGKVCVRLHWAGYRPVEETYVDLYVHPETGILCKTNHKKRVVGYGSAAYREKRAYEETKVFRVHDKNHHLYLEDGVWYVYTLAVTPPPRLVYECPMAVGYENWRGMTRDERAKIGHPTWVNDYVCVKPKAARDMSPYGMHYSSRQTAGRKILRHHGLVGSSVT